MSDLHHPFPGNQLRIAELVPGAYADFDSAESTADLEAANVVTSEMLADDDTELDNEPIALPWLEGPPVVRHRLVLDMDVPIKVVPSSTPGHSHLYIDVPMSWGQAVQVLEAMANAGILEHGYVAASEARGYTAVRLPWIRKPAEEVAARLARTAKAKAKAFVQAVYPW